MTDRASERDCRPVASAGAARRIDAPAPEPTPARRLSVVVVAFNRPDLLPQCLAALAADARPHEVDIVVVFDRDRGDAYRVARERCAAGRWVAAPSRATVPRMRSIGIEQCRGEIVALLEDDCVVEPGWCEAVIAAHRTGHAVIGGAVEPGPYRRALDWAVYFCEYGRFMLPLRPQPHIALALAGSHVTYKRPILDRTPRAVGSGFQDLFVHRAWSAERVPMRTEQTLVVRNVNSWSLSNVTSVPYHHGRAFAGQRFAGRPGWWRAGVGCVAAALPVLKTSRVIGEALARGRLLGPLVRALPWIAVFMTSWSLGEMVGCLRGPGESPSRWR